MASVMEDVDDDGVDIGGKVNLTNEVEDDGISQISDDPDIDDDEDDRLQVPTPSDCPLPSHSVTVSMMQSFHTLPVEGISKLEQLIPNNVVNSPVSDSTNSSPRMPQIMCSLTSSPNL